MERRLSAVLAADVVGYSRLMSRDEAGTLVSVQAQLNNVVLPQIEEHGGRLINIMGDGILAHFSSAVSAVNCGVMIQLAVRERNLNTSPLNPIVFRMGINLGDIILSAEGVHGHHINIATRLEQASKPGAINISQTVFDAIKGRTDFVIHELGERNLKNIDTPVMIYEIETGSVEEMSRLAEQIYATEVSADQTNGVQAEHQPTQGNCVAVSQPDRR